MVGWNIVLIARLRNNRLLRENGPMWDLEVKVRLLLNLLIRRLNSVFSI